MDGVKGLWENLNKHIKLNNNMTDQSGTLPPKNSNPPGTASQPPQQPPVRTYITGGGASSAGRNLRHQDPKVRSEAAKYMAAYRKKKKQTK